LLLLLLLLGWATLLFGIWVRKPALGSKLALPVLGKVFAQRFACLPSVSTESTVRKTAVGRTKPTVVWC
jgi:hypothetical protein